MKLCKFKVLNGYCEQQVIPSPDFSFPPEKTYHEYTPDTLGFMVSHRLTVYPDYCYYHRKVREGLFGKEVMPT